MNLGTGEPYFFASAASSVDSVTLDIKEIAGRHE